MGDRERAGLILGAAERLRKTGGRRPVRADVPLPDAPEAARDAGRELPLDEVVAYALG
jgi:hypothetical protein